LRRFMPSTRRMTTLAGAAFVGLAASAMLAAPASAHTAALSHDAVCDTETGKVKVTWTVSNDYPADATLRNVNASPALTTIVNGATVTKQKNGKDGTLSESVLVAPGTKVSLGFTATWPDGVRYVVPVKTVDTAGICKETPPPSPSESASPSPSGGTGGGGESPSPSRSAAPSLPVTGAQTGLYAGGAVVLLGAGAGLFLLARRRRIKFEA
jgi:LPXTG-motif cell wall-anchored protein